MKSTWVQFLSVLIVCPVMASASCIDDAANRYNVPVSIIKAISRVESHNNPLAFNRNRDGSYDIGLMQINSSWLPILKSYGINEQHLFDLCTNVNVGAWIVAQNIRHYGYGWDAIGAYNARDKRKRIIYAHRVADALALNKGSKF